MKIDIIRLAHTLFFPFPHYLDIRTGEIYSQSVMDSAELRDGRFMLLPVYTSTPIYQAYLDKLFKDNSDTAHDSFENYPCFAHRLIHKYDDLTETEYEYIDKAYHFLEGLKLNGNIYDDKCSDELEKYQDFEEAYMINFATEWCVKNGFSYGSGDAS